MSGKRYKPTKAFRDFYANPPKIKWNLTLPIDRSFLKEYVVNKRTSDISHYNLIRGSQLPEQIIIGGVAQDAHSGSIVENSLNFKQDVDGGDKVDMFC